MTITQDEIIQIGKAYVAKAQDLFDAMAEVRQKTIFTPDNYLQDGFLIRATSIKNIIVNGCGGTGGWFLPKLAKIMVDAQLKNKLADNITIYLCDGDTVATKNLIRQNFILRDVGQNKAEILANRYSQMFPANVNLVFVDKYIANSDIIKTYPDILRSKFVNILDLPFADKTNGVHSYHDETSLVFNFVDNSISRKCIHSYFANHHRSSSIVVDTGNNLYNGQMNVSIYHPQYTAIAPYPCNYFIRNFAELMETDFVKLENCADADLAVNNPEQMFNINDFAATITANMANSLFADGKIYYGLTTFVTGKSIGVTNLMPFQGVTLAQNAIFAPFAYQILAPIINGRNPLSITESFLPARASGNGRLDNCKYMTQDRMLSDNEKMIGLFSHNVARKNGDNFAQFASHYTSKLSDFTDFVNAKKLEQKVADAA